MKVANKAELQAEIKKAIEKYGNEVDLNYIDTSDIVDMSCLFYIMRLFNGDVSRWNTLSVRSMAAMFSGAISFNQDLSGWVDKSGRDIVDMFKRATAMQTSNK